MSLNNAYPFIPTSGLAERYLVVRQNHKICLAFDWTIMFRGFIDDSHSYFTPYDFSPLSSEMTGDTLHLFGAVGMALSYSTHRLDGGSPDLIFQDPRNSLFDFYEEEGQDMLSEFTGLVRGGDPEALPQELHVREVLALLETEEIPAAVREAISISKYVTEWDWPEAPSPPITPPQSEEVSLHVSCWAQTLVNMLYFDLKNTGSSVFRSAISGRHPSGHHCISSLQQPQGLVTRQLYLSGLGSTTTLVELPDALGRMVRIRGHRY